MKLEVALFARAKELARADTVVLDVPDGADVAEIRRALAERIPALAGIASSLHVAVGTEYATNGTVVSSSQKVACFPPVSGG